VKGPEVPERTKLMTDHNARGGILREQETTKRSTRWCGHRGRKTKSQIRRGERTKKHAFAVVGR